MKKSTPILKIFLKIFLPLHLKGRFSGKSQGYNLNFIISDWTMPVQPEKVFYKKHKKIDDNSITDHLTLLLSCRLIVSYYVIKLL